VRLLLTGATGFVGTAVREHAAAHAGLSLGCVSRDPPRDTAPGERWHELALGSDGAAWQTALAGVDAVVHLAARVHRMDDGPAASDAYREVNARATELLARQAAAAGVRRFVFVSSVKVNGERTLPGRPFLDGDPPAPAPDPYGISKLEAEERLSEVAAATGLETVVLRPPLMYGPGVRANFRQLLRLVDSGIPLPLGGLRNRRSLLYVGSFADAILAAAKLPAAGGCTYLVSDGEAVSTPELVRRVARALRRPARLFAVPEAALRLAAVGVGRGAAYERLAGSLEVDDGAIRAEFAWSPPFTMAEGLEATARWWRSRAA
jgi:nucleoside-diphosphate-sugar epimerase